MIIASINGIPGVGFAEDVSNGAVHPHRGKIQLSATNARRLYRLIEERAALVYHGPVWSGERWQLRSFELDTADIAQTSADACVVEFAERERLRDRAGEPMLSAEMTLMDG